MKILFLHGFGSDPNGVRPTFLKEQGYEVAHPALPDDDFEESVRIAQAAFDRQRPDVIVGSSRGGGAALSIESEDVPLVLIAPAWRSRGNAAVLKAAAVVLHSEHDDVVPIAQSRELLRQNGLSEEHLVVVGEDHRMVDAAAFGALVEAIERLGGR